MATHSSILAWRIPWTEEPGGLQSMGSQRATNIFTFTFWVGLKVCSGFSVIAYEKPERIFWPAQYVKLNKSQSSSMLLLGEGGCWEEAPGF